MITVDLLDADGAVRHAFFTRRGGVSRGLFASLNCGFGAGDPSENVARNRALAMQRLDLPAERLVTCRQVHSAVAVAVDRPWRRAAAPSADGMASRVPGVALGVLAADCAPVLFHDPVARVIGAAHAGWRGAFAGVIEATVAQMAALGAEPRHIRAGIGPCIGPASYEVGPEFPLPIIAEDPGAEPLFVPARRPGHLLFDLAGYVERRLGRAGVKLVQWAPHDTAAEEERFFSYRRASLRGETAYGRQLSAIALVE
ncbi:MAG TPA: peptidoglycan editing factor PgeF [Stellaceae bacterium]|nr:peptidoglycan editing factor PgeF [Stellaceae bacterium]